MDALNKDLIVELLTWLLSGLLIIYVGYLVLRTFFSKKGQQADIAPQETTTEKIAEKTAEHTTFNLSLRVQAYERLCLFLERIKFTSLIPRVSNTALSAQELKHVLLASIREELNHNLPQQLYVSEKTWTALKAVVESNMLLIHHTIEALGPEATQADLITKILDQLQQLEKDPIDDVLSVLRTDMHTLL